MSTASDPVAPAPAQTSDEAEDATERFLNTLLAQHAEETIAFRRQLHMHPELSRAEFQTTATIAARLTVAGLPVRVLPSRVGLTCDIAGDAGGPVVALRADIDALPIRDEKDVPYASTVPGVAHACGHDAHATIVLGAGLALDAVRRAGASDPGLPTVGPVRLLFQPCEEAPPGGARDVIAAGGMTGVDAIFALHCDPTLTVGQLGVRTGAVTSAADRVEIVLRGPGGHTARPEQTVNLLEAAGRVLVELPDRVLARLPSAEGHARLVFGMVAGGHAPNVIPTEVSVQGTFRTLDPQAWAAAQEVLTAALDHVVAGYGLEAQLTHERGAPPVVNDAAVTDVLARAAAATLGAAAVVEAPPSLGGEDFSFYLDHAPGSYARLGVAAPGMAGRSPALHTSRFDLDERALAVGIRTLVRAVLLAQRERSLP
jgi:amidohydrolase